MRKAVVADSPPGLLFMRYGQPSLSRERVIREAKEPAVLKGASRPRD